jgi:hypothetical protein
LTLSAYRAHRGLLLEQSNTDPDPWRETLALEALIYLLSFRTQEAFS